MCRAIQQEPLMIKVDSTHEANVIKPHFYQLNHHKQRDDALLGLFEHYQPESTVVFCCTKIQCRAVSEFLQQHNIEALAIHGDLEQRDREQVLVRFTNKSCAVLVATDVAARGLDINSLAAVINYELPHDPDRH